MSTKKQTHFLNHLDNETDKIGKSALSVLLALLTIFFSSTFCYAASSIPAATLKSVSIVDSASKDIPPTAVISYTNNSGTYNFDASGSSDSDGTIAQYKWDFGDGTTATGVTASHAYSTNGSYPVTLAVVDDKGGVGLSQSTISKAFSLAVNFQPATAPVPEGYVADSGLAYDDTRGYGWTVVSFKDMFDRNDPSSPDQTYDTLINTYPDAVWELKVPNGSYNVKVLVGDPSYPYAINSVQVESSSLIDKEKTSSSGNHWIERSGVFPVNDGQLTLTFLNSKPFTKLCRIIISAAN